MEGELRMSKGRVFQMVGAATGKLREPKHIRTWGTLWVPLAKNRCMTVLSAYAPTLTSDEDSKDHFYDTLHATLR